MSPFRTVPVIRLRDVLRSLFLRRRVGCSLGALVFGRLGQLGRPSNAEVIVKQ